MKHMMKNLSPNNRQIHLDKLNGKVTNLNRTLSPPSPLKNPVKSSKKMAKCTFLSDPERKELEFKQMKKLKSTYKAVEESSRMDPKTINSVIKSVNFMSRQLLSDCHVISKSVELDPMNQYAAAICAVTQPSIAGDSNKTRYEY